MSFLGDIVGDALGNVFTPFARTDNKLKRLHEQGELVPATIYAIRIVGKSDSADEYSYLGPRNERGPAGVRVPVAIDPKRPDRVTIDWPSAAEAVAAG